MEQYKKMLSHVLENGTRKTNRTGIDTLSVFGYQFRHDLSKGFPLLTTKKMFTKGIIHELLWFLSGDTNVKYLQDNGVKIWDEWSTEEQCQKFGRSAGELGPVYGKQWRNFGGQDITFDIEIEKDYGIITNETLNATIPGVDQVSNLIENIKSNPDSRRLIVTGWNPRESEQVALPPCHSLWQCYVADGKLSLQLYQRSGDIFLGLPFNIASYSLLLHMIAQVCDLEVGEYIHTIGDLHLYDNHIDQAKLQLSREPFDLPKISLNKDVRNIFDFKIDDIKIIDYKSHKKITAAVAI